MKHLEINFLGLGKNGLIQEQNKGNISCIYM